MEAELGRCKDEKISKISGRCRNVGTGRNLFLFVSGILGQHDFGENQIKFYLEQPISGSEAVKIVESSQKREESKEDDNEQITDFCIWGQREGAILSNDNLSRDILANVIMMCGNPELLFEDCRVPGREDLEGCLIDQESAWQLFGSSNVVGKEITYNGKNYTIRKVIPGTEKIAAFQISRRAKSKNEGEQADRFAPLETDECQLDRLTVNSPRDWTIQALQEAWSNQYGFSWNCWIWNYCAGWLVDVYCYFQLQSALCFYAISVINIGIKRK